MQYFLTKLILLSLLLIMGLMSSCAYPLREMPVTQTEAVQKHEEDRRFSFTYSVQVHPTDEALDIFLPVAQSSTQQTIIDIEIESDITGKFGQEAVYGNKFWHATLPEGTPDTLDIRLTYQVARPRNSTEYRETLDIPALSEKEKELFDKFMCYCDGNTDGMGAAAKDAASKIIELKAQLEAGTAEKSQIDQDLIQHGKDRFQGERVQDRQPARSAAERHGVSAEAPA